MLKSFFVKTPFKWSLRIHLEHYWSERVMFHEEECLRIQHLDVKRARLIVANQINWINLKTIKTGTAYDICPPFVSHLILWLCNKVSKWHHSLLPLFHCGKCTCDDKSNKCKQCPPKLLSLRSLNGTYKSCLRKGRSWLCWWNKSAYINFVTKSTWHKCMK